MLELGRQKETEKGSGVRIGSKKTMEQCLQKSPVKLSNLEFYTQKNHQIKWGGKIKNNSNIQDLKKFTFHELFFKKLLKEIPKQGTRWEKKT